VIPGSHLRRRAPKRSDSREGAVPIEMPKGSVALWANGVWHWRFVGRIGIDGVVILERLSCLA